MGTQFVLVGGENVLKLTVVMVAKLKKSWGISWYTNCISVKLLKEKTFI